MAWGCHGREWTRTCVASVLRHARRAHLGSPLYSEVAIPHTGDRASWDIFHYPAPSRPITQHRLEDRLILVPRPRCHLVVPHDVDGECERKGRFKSGQQNREMRLKRETRCQRPVPCHDSNRAVGSMLLAPPPALHPSSSGGSQCPLRMSVHERPLTMRPQAAMPHTAKHSMAATLRPATSRNVLRTWAGWAGLRVRLEDGVFETFHLERPRCRPRVPRSIHPSIHLSIYLSTHLSIYTFIGLPGVRTRAARVTSRVSTCATSSSHISPVWSGPQVQRPVAVSQAPCAEQSFGHFLGSVDSAQDGPVAGGMQWHTPATHVPRSLAPQSSGHVAEASCSWAQSAPTRPGSQWHEPSTQCPA